MTFLVLVVLFKTLPSTSETLQSLVECNAARDDFHVLVWDNSPTPAPEEQRLWLQNQIQFSTYEHHPENRPLSDVYNSTIQQYFRGERCDFEHLVIFDQDSRFRDDFFLEAQIQSARHPEASLFLPIVEAGAGIVSPANLYWFLGRRWSKPKSGIISSKLRTAINSGMVIRGCYLRERFPGYDPRLRFYGTDDNFMQTYAARESWIYVMDSTMTHKLARESEENATTKLWRHCENLQSLLLLNEKGCVRPALARLYCMIYAARQAVANRDRRFLHWK